jgi:hypothetical protein
MRLRQKNTFGSIFLGFSALASVHWLLHKTTILPKAITFISDCAFGKRSHLALFFLASVLWLLAIAQNYYFAEGDPILLTLRLHQQITFGSIFLGFSALASVHWLLHKTTILPKTIAFISDCAFGKRSHLALFCLASVL